MTSFLTRVFRPFSSMTAPAAPAAVPDGAQVATVAAGCFWGVEHVYRKEFGGQGLLDARVGYIGGKTDSPSYRAVCSGTTGREFPHYRMLTKVELACSALPTCR